MPIGSGWNITIRCDIHNHVVVKHLESHDILGRLKPDERHFMNYKTKYHMEMRFIMVALRDSGVDNLTTMHQVYKARLTYCLSSEVHTQKSNIFLL